MRRCLANQRSGRVTGDPVSLVLDVNSAEKDCDHDRADADQSAHSRFAHFKATSGNLMPSSRSTYVDVVKQSTVGVGGKLGFALLPAATWNLALPAKTVFSLSLTVVSLLQRRTLGFPWIMWCISRLQVRSLSPLQSRRAAIMPVLAPGQIEMLTGHSGRPHSAHVAQHARLPGAQTCWSAVTQ